MWWHRQHPRFEAISLTGRVFSYLARVYASNYASDFRESHNGMSYGSFGQLILSLEKNSHE